MSRQDTRIPPLLWLGAGLGGGLVAAGATCVPAVLSEEYRAPALYALLARHMWWWLLAYAAAGASVAAGVLAPVLLTRRVRSRTAMALAAPIGAAGVAFALWRGTAETAFCGAWDALLSTAPRGAGIIQCAGWAFGIGLVLSPLAVLLKPRSRPRRLRGALKGMTAASAALLVTLGAATVLAPPRPLNVLLITLDAQRADHLHCYGYNRDTSPNIDTLAARGALFLQADANAPWTLPSLASLMTGRLPMEHGAVTVARGLDSQQWLLAKSMLRNGYRTGGVGASVFLGIPYHITEGFQSFRGRRFSDQLRGNILRLNSGPWVTDGAIEFMRQHRRERFFLWLHYFEPHSPYHWRTEHHYLAAPPQDMPNPPPLEWLMQNRARLTPRQMQQVIDLYDGETRTIDHYVGEVLAQLDRLDLSGQTLVILSSDHGEEFMQHGRFGHSHQLYEDVLRVPLIMAAPGRISKGLRVATPVQLVDLAPTILDLCGIRDKAPHCRGHSLKPLLNCGPGYRSADIVASVADISSADGVEAIRSIRRGDWKLLHKRRQGGAELYNLASDPGERRNLAGRGLPVERQLWAALSRYGRTASGRRLELSPEQRESLRGLGYLN